MMKCVAYRFHLKVIKLLLFESFFMKLSKYLYAFNHVISNGRNEEGVYSLGELTAWHDFDGYTCYLGYKDLVMHVYFHSQFSYDYADRKTLIDFERLVEHMKK